MVPLVRCLGAGSCPTVSLAPKDHLTRLCDSVRPASSQVQGYPPHSSEGSRCPWLVRGISVLLAKDVMVPVPPADMKAGFFSPYFIVPKKSGGLRPILGLRILNWAFHKPPFKMLMQNRVFGCIRPQVRSAGLTWRPVLPCVDPSVPQAIPAVCVRRTSISVQVLPFGLSLSPPCLHESSGGSPCSLERTGRAHSQLPRRLAHTGSVSGSVMRTQGLVLSHLSQLGLRVNWEKSKLLSMQIISFLGMEFGFGQSDSAPHAGTRSVGVELLKYVQEQDGGTTETSFRGSWGIWRLQRRSHRWGCSIWDRFNTGSMAESRGGRGRAARCGSKSLQPAAKPSPRGQTFHSFGQECPWNRSPGTQWFTRMPPPRAGGPRSTGLQCRGFGRVPNCTGI